MAAAAADDARGAASSADAERASSSSTEDEPIVQCIVVRKDLDWPLGAMMAQACHASVAAIEATRSEAHTAAYVHPKAIARMHKVVYEAKSATALEATARKLTERGAQVYTWLEQPEAIPTALALKPYPQAAARVFCKGLRLLK